ncbi:hypothetical protein MKX07_001708, partial [Trichoderma sp. CBMAI-0711]
LCSPGDQHQAWANPFEETKPRIAEWTAKEIATIASRLDKQLGPEYISSRAGPGGSRVHYLTAEKVIGLANEVFGFNGWSSSIQNIQVDFADENPQSQRVSIGLSVIVRVTLRDGTYHEDVGYGSIENAKGKAMAFEKAKKEGTTDALKRTLRNFGNVLGNCIYDQDYVKQVTKIKTQTNKKFDPDNLHRHSDFVKREPPTGNMGNTNNNNNNTTAAITATTTAAGGPTSAATAFKLEPMDSFDDFLGELDEADFCVPGDGHPDEIMLPNGAVPALEKPAANETRPGQPAKPTPGINMNRPPQPQPHTPRQGPPQQPPNAQQGKESSNQGMAPPPQAPPGEPVAFFSARSTLADANQSAGTQNQPKQLFNPKAESPSIRKTPGIDHTSSKPVARNGQHVPPANSQATSAQSGNTSGFTPLRQGVSSSQARGSAMNPSLDQARRIGAPGGGSPLANRGQYKPPTMKRTLPTESNAATGPRAPLVDIPTNAGNGSGGDGLDAKRQKVA